MSDKRESTNVVRFPTRFESYQPPPHDPSWPPVTEEMLETGRIVFGIVYRDDKPRLKD